MNGQRLGKGTMFTTTQKLRNNILTVSLFQNDGVLGTFSLVEGTLAIGYQGGSFSLETLLYMTSNVGGY